VLFVVWLACLAPGRRAAAAWAALRCFEESCGVCAPRQRQKVDGSASLEARSGCLPSDSERGPSLHRRGPWRRLAAAIRRNGAGRVCWKRIPPLPADLRCTGCYGGRAGARYMRLRRAGRNAAACAPSLTTCKLALNKSGPPEPLFIGCNSPVSCAPQRPSCLARPGPSKLPAAAKRAVATATFAPYKLIPMSAPAG
jgi:hypothetical protein